MRSTRLILFLTIFVAMLGLSVLFPVLAPLSRELNLTESQVGWFSTIYSLAQFLTAPLWGARSERVGRKPVLVTGLVGFALSFALFGVVATLGMQGALAGWPLFAALLVARAVGGALSSATLPTAQAFMADLSERKDRTAAMGLIGAAFGLGIVFGPAIGALLSGFGLLAPVYFSAGLGLVTAAFAYVALRETRTPSGDAASTRLSLDLLARPGVALLLTVSMLYTLASVGMEQTLGFFVQDRLSVAGEEATRTIGAMLTIFGLVAAIVLIPTGSTFWAITAALGVVGLGSALLGPSLAAALSLRASEDEQGRVAGLNSSALALGRMLGPIIGTGLYQHVSPSGPYVFSGAVLIVLLAVAALALRPGMELVGADD
jgi:MFS family permease